LQRLLIISGPGLAGKEYADFMVLVTKAAFEAGITVDFFMAENEEQLWEKLELAQGFYAGAIVNAASFSGAGIDMIGIANKAKLPVKRVLGEGFFPYARAIEELRR
jgi:3-dehydroquinate dehydratase